MTSLGRADREYALLFDPVPELVCKINSRLRISLAFHTFWESWPVPINQTWNGIFRGVCPSILVLVPPHQEYLCLKPPIRTSVPAEPHPAIDKEGPRRRSFLVQGQGVRGHHVIIPIPRGFSLVIFILRIP